MPEIAGAASIMAAARIFVIGAVAAVAATVFMARKDPTDHYAALGVDRRASKDEIRAAYKQAALKFHPDKCASKRGLWHALLGGAERCARRLSNDRPDPRPSHQAGRRHHQGAHVGARLIA